MKNQKKLIILTGPSGVGKGTVVKEILGKEKNFWLSISATTREPRDCLLYTSDAADDQ